MDGEKYEYFVSYIWQIGRQTGVAYCNLERGTEIRNIDDIKQISHDMEKTFEKEKVVIFNYILLSKPEEENEGCDLCRCATYTETPFMITNMKNTSQKSRTVQIHYCPVCGRKLPMPEVLRNE